MTQEVIFVVGYDLASTLRYDNMVYEARLGAHRGNASPDSYESHTKLIGTVTIRNDPHNFPSTEALQAIREYTKMETLVAARHSRDFTQVTYLGHRPPPIEVGNSRIMPEYRTCWFGDTPAKEE